MARILLQFPFLWLFLITVVKNAEIKMGHIGIPQNNKDQNDPW